MPYAFAHPLAVIPVHKLLGRASVPSALVIGSVIPDAWYLVPGLARHDSHGLYSILLFCLPAGLLAYLAFHLIFKLPLLALLPSGLAARIHAWAVPGLPKARWHAVMVSIAAGAATHVAWDALTHDVPYHQLLQHGSTLIGSAILAWWLWNKLSSAPASSATAAISPPFRTAVILALLAVPAAIFTAIFLFSIPREVFDVEDARRIARAAGVTSFSAFGLLATAYCLAWRGAGRKRRLR